jgi:hypothetical protein
MDYCHGDAHGSREEYLEECYEDAFGGDADGDV